MTPARRFFLRLLSFFRSGRADAELTREINAHLQLLEDKFVAQGMSAEDAHYAAKRAFGGVEQVKEHQRDTRSFRWLDYWWLDIKLGARMLIKYPGLSLVGGVSIAVAIGFGTATFAFFFSHLYAALPLDEGDRVVAIENWDVKANNEERQSMHDFVDWRRELKSMEEIGAFRTTSRNLIAAGSTTELIRFAEITASGFRIARVSPLLGRPLIEQDHQPGAPPVLVIGHDVWQSRFGADRAVVGREVRLGNTVHTIVGVMPEGFAFPMNHSYWVPLRVDPSLYKRGEGPAIFIFGRLAPGVTTEQAQTEVTTIGLRAASSHPETHAQLRPQVLPYTHPLLDIQGISLWQVSLMQLMISTLLIVVAVNVAILVYARTATRQSEIAVRTAVGASRSRIVAQLFLEALVLSSVAAALGLVLGSVGLQQGNNLMLVGSGVLPPFWMESGVSSVTVVYVVALTILAAVIAGVVPAIQATGRGVRSTLQQLGGSTGLQMGRTWTILIVAQVGFAVAAIPVVIATGLGELRDATSMPTFNTDEFLVAHLTMDQEPPPGVDAATYGRELRARFGDRLNALVKRLEAEPEVAAVTFASNLIGSGSTARIVIDEGSAAVETAGHTVLISRVEVDFLDAFDAALLTGRLFQSADRSDARRPVVVNRTFAQRVFGGSNAVGRRVRYVRDNTNPDAASGDRSYEIVGVIADFHTSVIEPEAATAEMYHPIQPAGIYPASLVVRLRGSTPATFAGRVRELSASIDPTLRVNMRSLADTYQEQRLAMRLVALVIGLITCSVLLLSAAGIYALMSFTVAQRRKEIGIRTALGADAQRILWSIFSRAARQLAIGIVVGLVAVTLVDSVTGGNLMNGKGGILLPSVSVLMLITGLLAAVGPARRGLRIPPTQALRDQ